MVPSTRRHDVPHHAFWLLALASVLPARLEPITPRHAYETERGIRKTEEIERAQDLPTKEERERRCAEIERRFVQEVEEANRLFNGDLYKTLSDRRKTEELNQIARKYGRNNVSADSL